MSGESIRGPATALIATRLPSLAQVSHHLLQGPRPYGASRRSPLCRPPPILCSAKESEEEEEEEEEEGMEEVKDRRVRDGNTKQKRRGGVIQSVLSRQNT
ncbi:hypothetical protein EYF80_045952 [Liparis tanakae]|uniref:Uncharacterized protein n=1 Tax=Liparis tanakae TaxID=230148 RepID=A0A4Z2FRS8_9TELE|nr:hypothetical protein EYF80_045952 [Liparis tanakae]